MIKWGTHVFLDIARDMFYVFLQAFYNYDEVIKLSTMYSQVLKPRINMHHMYNLLCSALNKSLRNDHFITGDEIAAPTFRRIIYTKYINAEIL